MKKWNIFWNLLTLWKFRHLLKKTQTTVKEYGFVEQTILDDCTEEEKDGVEYLASIYTMLNLPPKKLREEIEIIRSKYNRLGKRK